MIRHDTINIFESAKRLLKEKSSSKDILSECQKTLDNFYSLEDQTEDHIFNREEAKHNLIWKGTKEVNYFDEYACDFKIRATDWQRNFKRKINYMSQRKNFHALQSYRMV
jgi:hypothetical protein